MKILAVGELEVGSIVSLLQMVQEIMDHVGQSCIWMEMESSGMASSRSRSWKIFLHRSQLASAIILQQIKQFIQQTLPDSATGPRLD